MFNLQKISVYTIIGTEPVKVTTQMKQFHSADGYIICM